MTKYAAEIADAYADLGEAGNTVTVSGEGRVYDEATGTWSGADVEETSVAIQKRGDPDRFNALNLVMKDAVTLLIAASPLTNPVKAGARITWMNAWYTVQDVQEVAPDGTPIVYDVIASRG